MKAGRTAGALFERLVEHLTARFRFFGTYRYIVRDQVSEFLDCVPAKKSRIGLPDELRLPMWPGTPGAKGKPAIGSSVLVQFIDGDRDQAYISAFQSPDGAGFAPSQVTIDATDRVFVGPSGKVELSSTAGGRVLRTLELVQFTGPFTDGDSFAAAAAAGSLVIRVSPTCVAPGPPGTGFSEAFA